MALKLTFARRAFCLLAVVLVVLGLSSLAANAGISTGLRNLLQGAMGTDLRVESLVLDKSAASVGETLRATVSISNGGRLAATSTLLTFWAAAGTATSSSNAFRLAAVRLGTLQPTNRITYVGTFPVPNFGRSGTYRILATVESSSYESNRQNNTQAKTLQILGPSFSDADPQPVSDAGTPPSPPAPGPVASAGGSPPPAPGSGPSSPPTSNPPSSSPSPSPPVQTATCDYYASPNGTGNGLSSGSPFKISNFWPVATAGKTLCLMDGTYQGEANMVSPGMVARGLSGTSSNPITIRALNDGAVTLDGQFAREPVLLIDNGWFVLEGFNAKSGSYAVVRLYGRSSNNILRRLVIWDAHIGHNISVLSNDAVGSYTNNLFEDIAVFGTGRKSMGRPGGTVSTDTQICRRCWFRWEGSTYPGGFTIETNYATFGFTCENCLVTWTGESMPQAYDETNSDIVPIGPHRTNFTPAGGNSGMLETGLQRSAATKCANVKVLGSLTYLPATPVAPMGSASAGGIFQGDSCVQLHHVFSYISPSHAQFNTLRGVFLKDGDASHGTAPVTNSRAHNITSVRGSTGDRFEGAWDVQNFSAGTSIAAVANPWTTTGAGANLCKRWVNGVVTNGPLWPWPMNQRIKDATRTAGAYAGPCPTCVGGRARRTETDVTAEVEKLLGPIAPQCKSS